MFYYQDYIAPGKTMSGNLMLHHSCIYQKKKYEVVIRF